MRGAIGNPEMQQRHHVFDDEFEARSAMLAPYMPAGGDVPMRASQGATPKHQASLPGTRKSMLRWIKHPAMWMK